MSTGLVVQYVIVGVIVLVSVLLAFRKLAPKLTNRWFAAASIRLGGPGRSRLAHALSRRLQPREATGNCADGCSTCGACGPKKPAAATPVPTASRGSGRTGQARMAVEPVPLHFRPRSH